MSSNKSQKAELIAIYRLEFYKKQNNWKLSSSKNPINPSKKSVKEILNTTYNVEEKTQEKELSDPLNVAFVDSDSVLDKNLKLTKSQNSPELSQEWQEPVNIWPHKSIEDIKPALHCTKQRLENLQKAADLADLENHLCNKNTYGPHNVPNGDEWPQYANSPGNYAMSPKNIHLTTNLAHSSQNNNMLSNFKISPQNLSFPTNLANCRQNAGEGLAWNECEEFEGNWPMETAIWVGAGHAAQDIYQDEDLDVIDGNTDNIYSGEWPLVAPPDIQPWSLDMDVDTSVDSVGEFMRGADGVPHSSEIDLSLPNCVKACDVSFSSLSRLSSQQLMLAARLHSRVLRRLLLESQARQKLRSIQSISTTDFSYEEFPTRDVGPQGEFEEKLFLKDVILAGSHKNMVGVGRGRGRLSSGNGLKPFSR